jgi:hypothetical protein
MEPMAVATFEDLPSELEYTGEFGAELILFLPFCRWLSQAGLLRHRTVKTYAGMGCYYRDLDCLGIVEKSQLREYVPPARRPPWLPIKDEHFFDGKGRSPFHSYPDLRSDFGSRPIQARLEAPERPLLVIHNKFNSEWNGPPVNFIPLGALDALFSLLKHRFTVVYVRHEMDRESSYSADHDGSLRLDDRALLERHPEVLRFQDLFQEFRAAGNDADVNTYKNALFSRCFRFISTQGGGAHHIAMFSGSLLLVLHRKGRETDWAYHSGYYRFLSAPPPVLVVCDSPETLLAACGRMLQLDPAASA